MQALVDVARRTAAAGGKGISRLGSMMIEGIPPASAGGVTVSVVYSINANGVLRVKA